MKAIKVPGQLILFQMTQCFFPLSQILTGSLDKTAKLWDMYTGKCINTFHQSSPINSVKISEGKQDIISSNNLNLLNIKTFKKNEDKGIIQGHEYSQSTISDCGTILAIATIDGAIKIINAITLELIDKIFTQEYVSRSNKLFNRVIITKDLDELLVCTDNSIQVYHLHRRELQSKIITTSKITSVAIYQDERVSHMKKVMVGCEDGKIRQYAIWGKKQNEYHLNMASITSISIKGNLMAVGSQDATVSIQEVKPEFVKLDRFSIHQKEASPITSVVLNNENKYCVIGNQLGEIAIYDIKTQLIIKHFEGHRDAISAIDIKTVDFNFVK